MKKLFVSCPMRGRTPENIKTSMAKMHLIAELIFNEQLEMINSYEEEWTVPEGAREDIWCLGKTIEKLAKADYFIGIHECYEWRGCDIEREIARQYGIPTTFVDATHIMPDAFEELANRYEEKKVCTLPTQQ